MTAPISAQLYSLREEARADFLGVIARLAEIGYAGVETAGLHDLEPGEFRSAVETAGMVVSSAHVQIPEGDAGEAVLDEQAEIGCRDLVVAFLPPDRFESADAIERSAESLNATGERVRARGMQLGYHNHWWEFARPLDGRSAFSALFDLLDPSIFAEVDTYWAQVGGADPAQVVADLGPRARFLHVKDGPADGPKSAMTAVGDGVVDVAAIAAASQADWHVVELDRCDTDMFEAVEKSYRYLVGEGLARGRK